jgi:hypothetical protein
MAHDPWDDFDLENGIDIDDIPTGGFEELVESDNYHMRFTGFERMTSQKGSPMAVFRLDVVTGPTRGGNSLLFMTLTKRTLPYVVKDIKCVLREGDDRRVRVMDDEWMKKTFLGKLVKVKTKRKMIKGEMKVAIDKLAHPSQQVLGDNPDDSYEGYWNNKAFNASSGSSGGGSRSSAPKSGGFDDDIPF